MLAVIISGIVSCQSETSKPVASAVTVKDSLPISPDISGCYRMIIEQDTASMQITQQGDSVSGNLSYYPYEKDRNVGGFRGTRKSNIIDVWYTFQSEGKTSTRQSSFKIIGNTLAEGYGDVTLESDTIIFKYPTANLNYEDKHPFTKITCP